MAPFVVKSFIIAVLWAILLILLSLAEGTSSKSSLPRYALKISKDGKDYDEQVSVDVQKGSENFHLREASSGKDAGDIIYDLKRNLTMIRVPEAKACFLKESTKNIPSPTDLLQLLKLLTGKVAVKITPQSEEKLKVDGILKDRSVLSKEMVDLCKNLPVYRVTEGDVDLKNMKQTNDAVEDADLAQVPAKRTKRDLKSLACRVVCYVVSSTVCSALVCHAVVSSVCNEACN